MSDQQHLCTVCGEPMPEGETMFKFHGYSGPCPKPPLPQKPDVIKEIAAERQRQIDDEKWSPEHDDEHGDGELAQAAAVYAMFATDDSSHAQGVNISQGGKRAPNDWPWDAEWFKPKNRRRDLVRAAALIVAEIERLDRAAMSEKCDGEKA